MNLSRSAYLFDDESQILWVYVIPTEHNLQLIIQFHTKYLKIEIFPTFVIIYRTPSRTTEGEKMHQGNSIWVYADFTRILWICKGCFLNKSDKNEAFSEINDWIHILSEVTIVIYKRI